MSGGVYILRASATALAMSGIHSDNRAVLLHLLIRGVPAAFKPKTSSPDARAQVERTGVPLG